MSFRIITFLFLLISIWAACLSSPSRLEAKSLDSSGVRFRRVPPRDFSVAVGASITVECEAFSVPPPAIHWLKNGKPINHELEEENKLDNLYPVPEGTGKAASVPHGATRSRLFIDCVDVKDEAIYTCVAENAFSRISTNTRLTVIQPIRRLVNPEEELLPNAMEEVAALELPANGVGGLAESTGNQQQHFQQAAGGLSAVSQCLNEKNSRSSEPVRIHFWTHNVLEEQKKDALLFCRSNARRQLSTSKNSPSTQSQVTMKLNPTISTVASTSTLLESQEQELNSSIRKQASISWMTPEEKLVTPDMKDKYEVLESGDLLIKNLSWDDMGSFVCTVSDELSSDSISSFVYPSSEKPPKIKRAFMSYLGF